MNRQPALSGLGRRQREIVDELHHGSVLTWAGRGPAWLWDKPYGYFAPVNLDIPARVVRALIRRGVIVPAGDNDMTAEYRLARAIEGRP